MPAREGHRSVPDSSETQTDRLVRHAIKGIKGGPLDCQLACAQYSFTLWLALEGALNKKIKKKMRMSKYLVFDRDWVSEETTMDVPTYQITQLVGQMNRGMLPDGTSSFFPDFFFRDELHRPIRRYFWLIGCTSLARGSTEHQTDLIKFSHPVYMRLAGKVLRPSAQAQSHFVPLPLVE